MVTYVWQFLPKEVALPMAFCIDFDLPGFSTLNCMACTQIATRLSMHDSEMFARGNDWVLGRNPSDRGIVKIAVYSCTRFLLTLHLEDCGEKLATG